MIRKLKSLKWHILVLYLNWSWADKNIHFHCHSYEILKFMFTKHLVYNSDIGIYPCRRSSCHPVNIESCYVIAFNLKKCSSTFYMNICISIELYTYIQWCLKTIFDIKSIHDNLFLTLGVSRSVSKDILSSVIPVIKEYSHIHVFVVTSIYPQI